MSIHWSKTLVLCALFIGALPARAQSSFSVTFDDTQPIPAALELGFGSHYTLLENYLFLNGSDGSGRTYFNTSFHGYYDLSFVADLCFISASDIFFMGLGQASAYGGVDKDIGLANSLGPVVGVRLHPISVASGLLGTIDHTGGAAPSFSSFGNANLNSNFNLLRFVWDGATHSGYFQLDAGYSGTFSADHTSAVISGANNGFSAQDSFLYFGSAGGAVVQSFAVTVSAIPEPSTYAALTGAGMLGWAVWRRRRPAARLG